MTETEYKEYFESELKIYFGENSLGYPPEIKNAEKYALFGGGKRVRPILCYLSGDFVGLSKETVTPLALCIEYIHTYSLIHDDLPCMDNDDFRRGRLTVHKKFGEAIALLAGDALLNGAYEIMAKTVASDSRYAEAFAYIADRAGANGMINGQAVEFSAENPDEKTLTDICLKKTGALISAAVVSPALITCEPSKTDALRVFAQAVGFGFQLADDLLDINKKGEKSYAGVFGEEKTREKLKKTLEDAKKALAYWQADARNLLDYCEKLAIRTK
jgi:geranylgeranyl diphosphate synthase type II